ncbi:hypothetical protein MIND_00293100 [Mycena indigotica]|uniref:Uncharacterized protein n=1 Tax=Mycena indigotica TaxID=2126181 RepID=A0A8H6WC01_9AGAR|nr:uncharacterized protein MIND_00293100 [Mycena indigotica]KAF7309228.1 hypothetical protein MIND_00293100 [Mycena indigotica]
MMTSIFGCSIIFSLRALNEEAQDWVNTWNFHILQIRGEPNRSPADIFFFNQIEEGVYGLPLADLADYGVDHGALRNEEVMSNFFANNEQERLEIPENMNTVICESPECPLLPVQVLTLDEQLEAAQMDARSVINMDARKLIWQEALAIIREFL